jgi:hypothetical protein
MSEDKDVTFTAEEISEQAQGNANFLYFTSISYLKEHSLSIDEYWAFFGEKAALTWAQGLTARDLAIGAARNWVAFGGELRAISGDESKAEAVLTGWPSEEDLEFFDLTQEEADVGWGCFEQIAEHQGYRYQLRRQGDEVTMVFWR